jgi:predicted nucleic acid-binding protein
MSKKIFIDSDIILDLLAERKLFYDNAAKIFTLAYNKEIELYTMAVVMANVFYVLRKIKGNAETKKRLNELRLLVHILPINENIVDAALHSKFTDFEDGLQYFTAKENDISVIITRNTNDYRTKEADIIVQTSDEYIKKAT